MVMCEKLFNPLLRISQHFLTFDYTCWILTKLVILHPIIKRKKIEILLCIRNVMPIFRNFTIVYIVALISWQLNLFIPIFHYHNANEKGKQSNKQKSFFFFSFWLLGWDVTQTWFREICLIYLMAFWYDLKLLLITIILFNII